MRTALYARVSTREGRQHLENQLQKLRAFAEAMKWTVVDEYTDEEKGTSNRRPGLDRMMSHASRRKFDHVVVFDLSRLTRGGPLTAFGYIARLRTAKVEFWSLTEEHFRTSGPAGELFIAIAAHLAAAELTSMKHRIHAGIDRARKMGTRIGRPALLVNGDRLQSLREQGKTVRQIAKELKMSPSSVMRRLKPTAA